MMTPLRARRFRTAAAAFALSAVLGGCAGSRTVPAGPAGGSNVGNAGSARHVRTVGGASYQDVCAPPGAGRASCAAVIPLSRAPIHQQSAGSSARRANAVQPGDDFPYYGWWPSDLQAAYALPAGPHAGAGMTVAIVDAFDAPAAEADLAVYRAFFGLPPCTTRNGCFKKVNARGRRATTRRTARRTGGRSRSRSTSTPCPRRARTAASCWSSPTPTT